MKNLVETVRSNFNPLFFQASLAAGGVALMAFNYLQFDVPHGQGLIRLSDITWPNLQGAQLPLYATLVAIMLVAVIVHSVLTIVFLRGLFSWLGNRQAVAGLVNDPFKNVTIFPVLGSLAMSANVLWAPLGFFVPWVASRLQSLMLPSLVFYGVLFVFLFFLEQKVLRVWFSGSLDTSKFNFVWLLDVFAFGLVALTGSGIAVTSQNQAIAAVASVATVATLVVGLSLLALKLFYLARNQIRAKRLPDAPVLPAFFLLVPIFCLFGLSLYRLPSPFLALFSLDIRGLSSFIISLAYAGAIAWAVFALVLLGNYLKNQFLKSPYSAPQWGLV